jgi:stress responsive alpha/beta barrel protein
MDLEAPAKRVDSFAVADGRSVHARELFGGLLSISTVMRIQLTLSDIRLPTKHQNDVSGRGPTGPAHSDLHARTETPISFTLMVHHIGLYKLKPEVTPARVEAMMMNTRMQLLKIPEVLSIKCGKRIEPEMEWPFFIAIDFESMDKFAMFREDPIYVKFVEEVIKPNTEDSLALDFEMDPGKDVRFS